MRRLQRIAVRFGTGALVSAMLMGGLWYARCPGPADAKGPRYVLWRLGILPFDPDVVYGSMSADRHAEDLVRGLSLPELKARFKVLRQPSQPDHYAQFLPTNAEYVWLGDTTWLLLIEHDRAVELRNMKGL